MTAESGGREESIPVQDRISYAYLTLKELYGLVRGAECEAFERALRVAEQEALAALKNLSRIGS